MNTDEMLKAIYKLGLKDGLTYSELSDITTWMERSGPDVDTTLLQEKSRERIVQIFNRFYEVKV